MKNYTYKTIEGKERNLTFSEKDAVEIAAAWNNYVTAKQYQFSMFRYIWRKQLEAYHMSTSRRAQGLKKWQTNFHIGLSRSYVDVFKSTLQEKPLTFVGTPFNKAGLENKENILKTLYWISDRTKFHTKMKRTMGAGLTIGNLALRISFRDTEAKKEYITMGDGDVPIKVTEESEREFFPTADPVDAFNIFPDPYVGSLRYISERMVISHRDFLDMFGSMIRGSSNLVAKDVEELIQNLPLSGNLNGADLFDYSSGKYSTARTFNDEARGRDPYGQEQGQTTSAAENTTVRNPDEDAKVTSGLIEVIVYTTDATIVIFANNYPVYVGENPYGFINYVVGPATDMDMRLGYEGIPFLLMGPEEISMAFMNNYIDSARSQMNPNHLIKRGLLLDERSLETLAPGQPLWVDPNIENISAAIRPLEKAPVTDYNVVNILSGLAQTITGVSEYNLGQSAGERTASGALAVTQSSSKRMSPYVSRFVDSIGKVADMWLKMCKDRWTSKEFIYILDEDGKEFTKELSNKDLMWGINVSLQPEGMFGAFNELQFANLLKLYQTAGPSGIVNSSEIVMEAAKALGFPPSKFVVSNQIKPDNAEEMPTPNEISNPTSPQNLLNQALNPQ